VARIYRLVATVCVLALIAACAQTPEQKAAQAEINAQQAVVQSQNQVLGNEYRVTGATSPTQSTIFDLFRGNTQPQRQMAVNRYLWTAALDTLSFLPMEGADPFSGVIVTGWGRVGTDPTPFRVTVYISEAALDARSLRVAAFRQQGGRAVPVSSVDNRRLEDAILTRARQLKIASTER
jgi:hypothetical protein